MATKDAGVRARIDNIKEETLSITTCSSRTIESLHELLLGKTDETVQKENVRVRVQTTARRRAGTAAATASVSVAKQTLATLTSREKYILATEVANTTLKTLTEALKNTPAIPTARPSSKTKPSPSEDTRRPSKVRAGHGRSASVSQRPLMERSASQTHNSPQKRLPRRSSSYSSFSNAGPEAGLVASAECARLAFGYLGTPEAAKVLGKDSQELQYENGVIVLIGKLVALGLDTLAVKELRTLKKRLNAYLSKGNDHQGVAIASDSQKRTDASANDKETLAGLLAFGYVDVQSPALPLVATFQTYVLRIIAKLRRPQVIESAWQHLKLSNTSSVVNLIWNTAKPPTVQEKAARQLESLAQTILTLCPSVSTSDDDAPSQPSPDTVLMLQQLAFKIRQRWWILAKHQGNEEQELLNPFAKCIAAFARRSQLTPSKKYKICEALYTDLRSDRSAACSLTHSSSKATTMICKAFSSLAQAADLPDEALRWLDTREPPKSTSSAACQTSHSVQLATVSLEAHLKDKSGTSLQERTSEAIEGLTRGLGGTTAELESLFLQANKLRRVATRLLITSLSSKADDSECASNEQLAISLIAACVHFNARFAGSTPQNVEEKHDSRSNERSKNVWGCLKSIVDSVLACCKSTITNQDDWNLRDKLLQETSHIVRRLEQENEHSIEVEEGWAELVSSSLVKLSNGYWSMYLQMRKADVDPATLITAMERSTQLIQSRSISEGLAGYLPMKLEQLGEALESSNRGTASRQTFERCIRSHLSAETVQIIEDLAAKSSLSKTFSSEGPLAILARVLKAYHRSFLRFGIKHNEDFAFYDDSELAAGVRGALLEWQLGFFLRTLSKNRRWDSGLDASITCLTDRLCHIYTSEAHPVRRLRLSGMLLHLLKTHAHILSDASRCLLSPEQAQLCTSKSCDAGLCRYEKHLRSLQQLRNLMQTSHHSPKDVRECFAIWESLLNNVTSWDTLTDCVDEVDDWLQELQACVDCLNARGEEALVLGAQYIQIRVLELRRDAEPNDLVAVLCSQALQFLRLGYTGKSGLSLAKVEALTKKGTTSTEAVLQWHISYAEYLLAIGDSAKCASIIASAQAMAIADPQFMGLAKPTTSLSGRVRFNRILADATYVQSLLAAHTGCYKDAAQYVKQSVSLNRRIWAALESRATSRKPSSPDEPDSSTVAASKVPFDPLSSSRSNSGMPVVMSVTHDALNGPEFWSLVPSLYRGIMQHSRIFISQGLLHEAIFIAEQAEKIASATESPTLQTDNASWRADCWAQSGRNDKAEELLGTVKEYSTRKCISSIGYHSAIARIHHHSGRYDEEAESYTTIVQMLDDLASPAYIRSLDSFLPAVDQLAEQIEEMSLNTTESTVVKKFTSTRGRKPAVKATTRPITKPVATSRTKSATTAATRALSKTKPRISPPETCEPVSSIGGFTSLLSVLKATVLDRKVIVSILQDNLSAALDLLTEAEQLQNGSIRDLSHMWAIFKTRLAQSLKQIAEDFTVNTLPESTIAFPAIGLKERRSSEEAASTKVTLAATATGKGGRGKTQAKQSFIDTLQDARDRLVEAQSLCATSGPNHLFQQVSMALSEVTVLLSAVSGAELRGALHPLYAAYMSEIPKCNALKLIQSSVDAEKIQVSRDDCLKWPGAVVPRASPLSSIADFQRDYVDIIPGTWSVISMSLNEGRDELYVTRFESGNSPFVLRLPLARQASREMDEEEFSFEDGKRDFDEIIELSDFSTRTAKDMTSKDARQQWWTEREALDSRLHELLVNIENIWLGGFKGIFSQHERQMNLLARFQKSLENVLNNHLPSRKKKTQQKRPTLDPRVLDLFIGLGNANDASLDLDEALTDLIYFVVDILHFNGERNAYDEIDFDAMVVEVYDALRAYHSVNQQPSSSSRHTILILDKHLHAFPWESLPCLVRNSISRLSSLAALRERLIAARNPLHGDDSLPGHHIRTQDGGTSILNPSGDLAHTSKIIRPHLDDLQGPWNHIADRAPSEKEFEDSLREQDLVLYFGHGSGAQYIKSKSVRRLYPGQQDENNAKAGCATTLLFGCSSVHLTENGIYEPSGMLASYLTAGAPAVLGMLWDVTDKDCDRFAVKVGELWGLWPEHQDEVLAPKTPAKRGKAKGRKGVDKRDEQASVPSKVCRGVSLDEAVRDARKACVLRYLNGAAAVVYGIPVYVN
ncbi:separin protein [Coniothyrium glycines]